MTDQLYRLASQVPGFMNKHSNSKIIYDPIVYGEGEPSSPGTQTRPVASSEPGPPIRDYNVKNNSELLAIVSEGSLSDGEEISLQASKGAYPPPYHTRWSVPQGLNPLKRSVKDTASLKHPKLTTISKNNTTDERSRKSASFAYLGSKLTKKRPNISTADPYSDGRESFKPKRIKVDG